ncbi:MAG TPA: hypothetical protein VI756_03065 [Blastocatellia bacterium]
MRAIAMNNSITIQEYLGGLIAEEADKAQQVAEATRQLEELRLEINGIRKRLGIAEASPNQRSPVSIRDLSRPKAAPILIANANRWLTASQIADLMEEGGIELKSDTSRMSLYGMLKKHPALQSATNEEGLKVYGLAEWDPLSIGTVKAKANTKKATRRPKLRGGRRKFKLPRTPRVRSETAPESSLPLAVRQAIDSSSGLFNRLTLESLVRVENPDAARKITAQYMRAILNSLVRDGVITIETPGGAKRPTAYRKAA